MPMSMLYNVDAEFPDDFYVFGAFGGINENGPWRCELRATPHTCPTFHKITARFDELHQKIYKQIFFEGEKIEPTPEETYEWFMLGEELFGPGEVKKYFDELRKWIESREIKAQA